MKLFRREPLHERLAREGGLGARAREPHDVQPRWGEAGIHGLHRPRTWDAVVTAEAPELERELEETSFVSLPDGNLIVEAELSGEALAARVSALAPLAAALESELAPPYRAEAVRRGRRWAVAGKAIRVAELPPGIEGRELQLTAHEGRRELRVDGEVAFGSVPALEWLAGRHDGYVVRAERLTGALWEVTATPL